MSKLKKSRRRKVGDKNKFAEKMSTYMMLMGYSSDYHLTVAKELNRRVWKRKGRLGRRRIRRLQYLLCAVDSATLLAFTVSLGRLIWSERLRIKWKRFEKKLSEKVKERSIKKNLRRGRPRRVKTRRGWSTLKKRKRKGSAVVPKFVTGYPMRPVWGSNFRMVVCHRGPKKHTKGTVFGTLMYRLAMAMNVLCYRNVCITSEWEFWTVCLVKKVCGFWRSVAIAEGLSDSLVSVAKKFGLSLVSIEVLERLESCFSCSSSARYIERDAGHGFKNGFKKGFGVA